MTNYLLTTIALLLIVNAFVLVRLRQEKRVAPALDPYELLHPVLIICGDCSGDSGIPRKTLLAANGRCEACGGDNYVLASAFGLRFYNPTVAPELRPGLKQQPVYVADYCYNERVN